MKFNRLTDPLIREIRDIVGPENAITEPERMEDYSHDEFGQSTIARMPELVVRPRSTGDVSQLLRLAHENRIPVTPRGGGTGLCGGCVPACGGMVLSMERMNALIEIDADNLMAVVEAGLRLEDFYRAIEGTGLFFPPHPGDEGAMIGGLIATNAGGARAVKYGVIRNYVRGLEAVLPDGTVTRLGGKLMKSSTGYSLMNLLVGSEGTLGVITRATLGLSPLPGAMSTIVVPFERLEDAIGAVPLVLRNRIVPMAAEFMARETIAVSEHHLGRRWPCECGGAQLMFILDADGEDELLRLAGRVCEICASNGSMEAVVAGDRERQRNILDIRSRIYSSMRGRMFEILDLTVPRASIARFVQSVRELERRHDAWLPTYGHAADGNVHTHLMNARWTGGEWREIPDAAESYPMLRKKLHEIARDAGGVISGEHGIGIVKREFMADFLDGPQLALMKAIKKTFDPLGILNPGKVLPD